MAIAGKILLKPRGAYSPTETYGLLDVVMYDHRAWVCTSKSVKGHTPSEGSDPWVILVDTVRGEKGDRGVAGIQGIPGLPGEPGEPGRAFTYADFTPEQLEALRGPQGEQGEPGESIVGPKGDKGDKGDIGPQGPEGPQGPRGDRGESIVGPQGPEGPQGERGPEGPQGPAGPRGPEGPQGAKGDKGDQGPEGPQGLPGTIDEQTKEMIVEEVLEQVPPPVTDAHINGLITSAVPSWAREANPPSVSLTPFFVTMTPITDDTFSSDKSMAEVAAAIDGGRAIGVVIDIGDFALVNYYLGETSYVDNIIDSIHLVNINSVGVSTLESIGEKMWALTMTEFESVTDDHINDLIDAKLGGIENGSY